MTTFISVSPSVKTSTPPAPSLVRTLLRIVGSAVSWASLATSMFLLAWEGIAVAAIGGSCASGGPYVVAVQCPEGSGAHVAVAVVLMFVCVLGGAFASGFGTSLIGFGWFFLFGGFGTLFLLGWAAGVMSSGLLVGGMFVLMAIVPIGFLLWASPRGLFIGKVRASGERYYPNKKEFERLTVANPTLAARLVAPRAIDWILALSVWLVSLGAGLAFASSWVTAS